MTRHKFYKLITYFFFKYAYFYCLNPMSGQKNAKSVKNAKISKKLDIVFLFTFGAKYFS